MDGLRAVLTPNRTVAPSTVRFIVAVQVLFALGVWWLSPFAALPKPQEVARAFAKLWLEQGLSRELLTSFMLNLEALAISTVIALSLSYLTVLPVFRPIAAAISKGRFLGMVGLTFVFTLLVGGGRPLKLALLTFGLTVFFLTSMVALVEEIPKSQFDHARTLRMSEWRVVWEVVVLGTADGAIEVLRQNAAIGWMMLTMVEGISRSEGGVGAMLLNQEKHFHLAEVFAIQLMILTVGLLQDFGIGVFKRAVCPYAELVLERQ